MKVKAILFINLHAPLLSIVHICIKNYIYAVSFKIIFLRDL